MVTSTNCVRVARFDGSSMVIEVEDSDTIAKLKQKLWEKGRFEGLAEHQRLLWEGWEPPEDRSLLSLGIGITANGVPTLYHILPGSRTSQTALVAGGDQITVKIIEDGRSLVIDKTKAVAEIRKVVANTLQISSARLCLIGDGEELLDNQKLSEGTTIFALSREFKVQKQLHSTCEGAVAPNSMPDVHVGGLVRRQLDGIWFEAQVLKKYSAKGSPRIDLRYSDDGKVEQGVNLQECIVK
eukprot:TRINITY_DN78678_c0_g1_i1.p1 TRINITY_DN78678_c0_g1~~TRINITY_DN78678_c0_g1_i1.p1  ORF type:complete len:240 (+),score=43.14 TRINITY_DN78678_c0_g1_i1:60-779(+)